TAVKDHPDKVKKAQTIAAKGVGAIDAKQYVNRRDGKDMPWGINGDIVAPLILREDPLMLNVIDVRATGGSGLFPFVDEEIRKKQALKLAEEAKEAEKKAAEKARRDAKSAENAAGPGGGRARRGEVPGAIANEPIDPNHPNRRMVQG